MDSPLPVNGDEVHWRQATSPAAAMRAYRTLGGDVGDVLAATALTQSPKSAVYRLHLRSGTSLVLKSIRKTFTAEIPLLRDILPDIGVRAPRLHSTSRDATSGRTWLLLEDVGSKPFRQDDSTHQRWAAAWIAQLHSGKPNAAALASLPRRGLGYYRVELGAARQALTLATTDSRSDEGLRALADRLDRILDVVDLEWSVLTADATQVGDVIAHGDLQQKNVCVESSGEGLVVLDWETAGWGTPAVDLGSALAPTLGVYARHAAVSSELGTINRLATIGVVLREVMAIRWLTYSLPHLAPAVVSEHAQHHVKALRSAVTVLLERDLLSRLLPSA